MLVVNRHLWALLIVALISFISSIKAAIDPNSYANISAIYTSGFSAATTDPATQLSVYVKLVKDSPEAIVYCGSFPTTYNTIILIPFSSPSDILKQGFYAYTSNGIGHLVITGLIPASTYDVYCMTVSQQNTEIQMPYDVIIHKSALSSTQCCKMAYFTTSISSLPAQSSTAANSKALTLYLSAYPLNNVTLTLQLYNTKTGETDPSSVGTLTPSEVTFYNTYMPNTIIPIVYESKEAGTYGINVTMSGDSEVEYLLELIGTPKLTVLSENTEPSPPVMTSATFSNDGSYVTVTFDVPTNQGGYANTFFCSDLLYFDGMAGATCSWADNRNVIIYPAYAENTPILKINSPIAVYPDAIQAYCTDTVNQCSSWTQYTKSVTVRVKAPTGTATLPTVVISGPSTVGACSPITLDLSNSIGSAGRPWKSTVITVKDTAYNVNITKVSAFLNSTDYTISPPTAIPRNLLISGHTYTFTAVFCNFLGACNTASKAVAVSNVAATPIVTISGLTTRTITTWTPLLITATAYTQTCGGGQSVSNLQYSWALYESSGIDVLLPDITSLSQNPAAFKLNAYTLTKGKTYRAQVSVLSLAAGASTLPVTASVFIVVNPSNLVAVIADGSSRSVQAGQPYTVDASGSYDKDTPGAVPAELSYSFACWQTVPTYNSNCPVTLTDGSSYSKMVVTSDSSLVGSVVRITVTVFDATRTASTYIDLTFTENPSNVLSVTSSLTSLSSVNVNQQITLRGSLDIVSPCTAVWSVDDSALNLANIAVTPVTSSLTALHPAVNSFTMLLPGGVLPQRASLTFSLTCGDVSTGLSMTTNGSPLPGSFKITPSTGVQITTPFTFTATRWIDPDLPLSYQFGFISPSSGALLVFQGKSETSFASTKLPSGGEAAKNVVFGTLQVYDVYGAASNVQVNVTVSASDVTQQTSGIYELIQSSSGSVDDTNAVIATVGSVLNAVNCTGTPVCSALKRYDCSTVSHTCGICKLGYFGVAGSQNSACMTLDEYTDNNNRRYRRHLTVGLGCSDNPSVCNAGNWETCRNGYCAQQQKSCPNDCSEQGQCQFLAASTGNSVNQCGVADSSCIAVCKCNTGFGGPGCSLTSDELAIRMAFRANLIASLDNITRIDDVNEISIARWATALSSLSQNFEELSTAEVDAIHKIANLTITYAKTIGTSEYASLIGILDALNSATSVLTTTARRRLQSGEGRSLISASTHRDILGTAGSFGDVIANGMAVDQASTVYVYDNFRLSTQVQHATPGAGFGVSGGQSDLEYYSGTPAPFVNMAASDEASGIVATSLIVANANSYTAIAGDLVSNPLQLRVDSPEKLSKITFTLHNNVPNNKYIPGSRSQNFTLHCTTEIKSVDYLCVDSGVTLTQDCTGIAGVHTTFCPVPTPQCSYFNSEDQTVSPSGCSVVDNPIQAEYTTCECKLNSNDGRRQLTTFSDVLSETGVTNMVTTSTYIASSFASTFKQSDDLTTPAAAQKVLIVILLFAILWAVGLLSLVGLCFKRQKVVTNIEKRRSHKVGTSTHTTTDVKKYLLAYVDKLIPDVYHATKSKMERAVDETRKHHRYLQLFTARDDQIDPSKRILTLIKMLTVQTMLMFLLAVLYDLQGPDDDGSCPKNLTRSTCLHRVSILDSSQKYCRWSIDHAVGYNTCTYQSPQFTPKIMMYIILLTSIFTSIFNTPIDKLFDTLEAPTDKTVGESRLVRGAKVAVAGARRASTAAVNAATTAVTATASRLSRIAGRASVAPAPEERALANRRIPEDVTFAHTLAYMALPEISAQAMVASQRQSVVNNEVRSVATKRITQIRKNENNQASKKSSELRDTEKVDNGPPTGIKKLAITSDDFVDQLLEEIMQQRLILPQKSYETALFDAQWGIEVVSVPSTNGKNISTSLYINGYTLRGMSKDVASSDQKAKELQKKMETFSDNQVGLDILHLFMVDLLGRHTLAAKIFENKFEEDFERTQVVSRYTKWLVVLIIAGLNAFFMYYSLLKGYEKGIHWQNQYLQACITQLFIEIFLFESMECVWINYWVPDLVSGEVMRAGVILRESAEKISLREKNSDMNDDLSKAKFFLDAPSYLFVSTKLAKKFPTLLESIIVSGYRNHLPGEMARTWSNKQNDEAETARNSFKGRRGFGSFVLAVIVGISSGLAVALQMLGSLPYFYQRIIIRFVQPVFLSGLTILWYFAVKNPIYTAVIVCVLALLMLILYVRYKNRVNNASSGKIAPIRGATSPGFAQLPRMGESKMDEGGSGKEDYKTGKEDFKR